MAQHVAPLQQKQIKSVGKMPALQHLLDGGNVVEGTNVDEMAGDGCGCGHNRADEVRAAVLALAALEIAIAGAGAALVRRKDVGVHADAHAAAGVAPLESGGAENF